MSNPLRTSPVRSFTASTGEVWTLQGNAALKHDALNTRYLALPGATGDYASTPDTPANSITGDIDIRVRAALTDWTPAAAQVLAAKWSTSGNLSWTFQVAATGVLQFTTSNNGSTSSNADSSVATGIGDGAWRWVRVTRASATGAIKFYTSANGTAWTQLGTDRSNTSGTIFNSNAIVEVGARVSGSSLPANGRIGYVEIRSGIGGAVMALFDPARDAPIPFPAALPRCTLSGYELAPDEAVARSDMEQGPARSRRRFTATPTRIRVRWVFTLAEMEAFEAWHKYDTWDGQAAFTVALANGMGVTTQTARFLRMWRAVALPGLRWEVSGELEVGARPLNA